MKMTYRHILMACAMLFAASMTGSCTAPDSYGIPDAGGKDEDADKPTEVLPPYQVRARKNATSNDWKDYLAYTVDCIEGFTPGGKDKEPETDQYGGWKVGARTATGFFRTENIDGRWWLITPEGNLYLSKGVAVFSTGGSDRQAAALAEKFGTKREWARRETARLKSHGFNSLGAWSAVSEVRQLTEKMPYTVIVNPMGNLNGYMKSNGEEKAGYAAAGWEGYPYDFACIFHEKFLEYVDNSIKTFATYRDDPYLIGYFVDNEIPWKQYALERCLTRWPATHVNHIKAQEWLDARKGKIGAQLSEATDADKRAFIAYCLDYYLKAVTDAIKKYDPNHLFLGCRFNQWNYELVNDEIFKVAGKYMDVISVNHYQKWQPDQEAVQNWAAWSGKPFMVTEYYVKGEDSGLPNNTGAGWNVRTQEERGYFFQNFTRELIRSRTCVGWHWFTYMDNDPENMNTDPSNRDSNKGIVKWNFEYYDPLIRSMEEFNYNVYQLTRFYR